eukprot:TRINITY_DN16355_c0_g1_i3.p2 TRINITY_DN16355_c0_g1~~TRINITY_DN16355_c0_g1_i3.p2  ORF type:complete len:230 (-),score=38.72 TRINITY_DN16355_c0_g1_i3:301-990(-)
MLRSLVGSEMCIRDRLGTTLKTRIAPAACGAPSASIFSGSAPRSAPAMPASYEPLALNTIADNPGAHHKSKRVGRGIGSGKGKTCGRGHKGQKSRSGGGRPHPLFEGGQTPIIRRLPKRGFRNRNRDELQVVNLDRLQYWAESGRLPTDELLTMRDLVASGVVGRAKHGIKVLGGGAEHFNVPLKLAVTHVTERAKSAIEQAGGSVEQVSLSRREVMLMVKGARKEQRV